MKSWKSFPFIVFLLVLITIETIIALAACVTGPEDISVEHGITTTSPVKDSVINSKAIDSFMIENMKRSGVSGAILAIVKDDRILHTAGYGYTSSGSGVSSNTGMPIASLSKSMTATAIMMLVDKDIIRLDSPVHDYLTDFKLADQRGSHITVRQLLNQSSGLASNSLPPEPSGSTGSSQMEVMLLNDTILVSDPGTGYTYCNTNYYLLSCLAERVSDLPFEKFLHAILFKPLEMNSSHVYFRLRDAAPVIDKGTQLVYGISVPRDVPDEIASGAGGVISSAEDLAKWLLFNTTWGLNPGGRQLLSSQNIREMHRASAPKSNYGFGWKQDILNNKTPVVHHSGIARAFTAHQSLFPESGYGYAFVLNAGHFFRTGAASFRYGLDAIMTGSEPVTGWPFTLFGLSLDFIADNIMAILTAFFVTIGIAGSLRARIWAEQRPNCSWIVIWLGMIHYFFFLIILMSMPWVLKILNRGQPVELKVIFNLWPPFFVFFCIAFLALLSVIVLRTYHIISIRHRR